MDLIKDVRLRLGLSWTPDLASGTVSNTKTISGGGIGGGSAATNAVTNAGGIYGTGTNSAGVNLGSGGTVTNLSGGTIKGLAAGVFIKGGSGSVSNAGEIHASSSSGAAVLLHDGGTRE